MMSSRLSKIIIASMLLGSVLIVVTIILLREPPPQVAPPRVIPLVETVLPDSGKGPIIVQGTGTVTPQRSVVLAAEVGGKIMVTSPAFGAGGTFSRGDVIAQIDPTDYEHALTVAQAEVVRARFEWVRAKEESALARDEVARLERRVGEGVLPADSVLGALALKEPQVRLAEAAHVAALARRDDAAARLERTKIRAPFDGKVGERRADVGQFVAPGSPIATFYNTASAEVEVALRTEDAARLSGLWARPTRPIPATVIARFGGFAYRYEATITRASGAIDRATRTLKVIAEIRAPYLSRTDEQGRDIPPLWTGSFVTVEIASEPPPFYVRIPRAALREDGMVWVAVSGRLQMRPVTVLREEENEVVITSGIDPSDAVIISRLPVATDGMEIRTSA